MAYKVALETRCESSGCTSRASFVVRAYGNEDHGKYCGKHADQRVTELMKAESMNPDGFRRG